MVQIRELFLPHDRPTSETRASNAKDPILGLHRPPGHSKSRSSQHMESMGPWRSTERARSIDASTASPARPLLFPRAGHTQAMWMHQATPLQPDQATTKILVQKYHSLRHDQREPSTVSPHDGDETDAGVRRSARQEVQFHHQRHRKSAMAAQASHEFNMPRIDCRRGLQRSTLAFLTPAPCAVWARVFDRSELTFSRELRFRRTVNTTHVRSTLRL